MLLLDRIMNSTSRLRPLFAFLCAAPLLFSGPSALRTLHEHAALAVAHSDHDRATVACETEHSPCERGAPHDRDHCPVCDLLAASAHAITSPTVCTVSIGK